MNLRLIREPSRAKTTLGVLFVDDEFFCFTLEDQLREQDGVPVEVWKIPKETAIPAGTYAVVLSYSPRFNRVLPELIDVPGFTHIRVHSGNRADDSEGCILLGLQRANAVVVESRVAVTALMDRMKEAIGRGESISIRIENPLSHHGGHV